MTTRTPPSPGQDGAGDRNNNHLRFLVAAHLVLIGLVIGAGLQSRYRWSVLIADVEYIAAGMILAYAATRIYGRSRRGHER